jgi:hypothetical protein
LDIDAGGRVLNQRDACLMAAFAPDAIALGFADGRVIEANADI